jgi:hypothetical protein
MLRWSSPRGAIRSVATVSATLAVVLVAAACTSGSATVATTTTAPTTTIAPEATTTTTVPLSEGRRLFVYNPEPGQCFDLRTAEGTERQPLRTTVALPEGEAVVLVDCALPHQYEVSALVAVPAAPTDRPGDDALITEAKKACPPQLSALVGLPYERSGLEAAWLLPNDEEWRRGRKEIACLVYDPAAVTTTGSLRGAAR